MQELLVVRRVPAAYKQCLAECVRRCGHGGPLRSSESSRTRPSHGTVGSSCARQCAAVLACRNYAHLPQPHRPSICPRDAFMEKYAHSAAQLAERMGAFREKELAMRDAFRKHVERWVHQVW